MKTPTDLALAALNGFKWLGNNLHNIRSLPDQFESFYKAALDDAEKAIAALSPAPDPIAPGHNPDRLTVSQVGEGWRLLDRDEVIHGYSVPEKVPKGTIEHKQNHGPMWTDGGTQGIAGSLLTCTYRTRLTREELAALDKPEEKKLPEEWSKELNITVRDPDGWDRANFETDWMIPLTRSEFNKKASRSTVQRDKYVPSRFAKPAWQLPAPPAGQRWHRDDFAEADLPEGYRPLMLGEAITKEDEFYHDSLIPSIPKRWASSGSGAVGVPVDSDHFKHRTTRPLPSAPVMVPWDFESAPMELKVKRKSDGRLARIDSCPDGVALFWSKNGNSWQQFTFAELLADFVQLDGSPCGIVK